MRVHKCGLVIVGGSRRAHAVHEGFLLSKLCATIHSSLEDGPCIFKTMNVVHFGTIPSRSQE